MIDRTALRQTRGGPTLGTIATHFLPPGVPVREAGGDEGPGFDFTSSPTANVALAKEYMKKAGYKNGMYDGPPLLTVADNVSPAKETAEAFQEQVKKIGIKLQLPRGAARDDAVEVLPGAEVERRRSARTSGGAPTSSSAQSFFVPLFDGKNIVPSGNVNTAEVNDPKLNKQIDKAEQITDPAEPRQGVG